MTSFKGRSALVLGLALTLAACGGQDEVKKGQVVAVVGGKEITVSELNAELAGYNVDPKFRDQARDAALQALINRTILTNIARERKIDQSPAFQAQKRRAEEGLLVQALQQSIAGNVPAPSQQEVSAFMQQRPQLFANRQIYTVDQIQFQPPNQQYLKSLESIKTMEELEQRLIQTRVKYQRGTGKVDPLQLPAQLTQRILALPKDEVFVIPTGNGIISANKIAGSEAAPFTGNQAVQYATNALRNERASQKLERELKPVVDKQRAEIKYQPGFEPKKQPGAASTAS